MLLNSNVNLLVTANIKSKIASGVRLNKVNKTFDYDSKNFRKTVEYKKGASTWNQRKRLITGYLDMRGKNEKILELGCGEVPLFEKSKKIDIANLPNLDMVHDLNNPIPIDDKFDAIIALELIGHLWNVDGFLKECSRLLKDGGALVVSSLNVKHWKTRLQLLFGNDERFDENGYYHWFFSPKSLRKKLEEHGFKLEVSASIGRLPFINLAGRFIYICSKQTFQR